MTDARHIPTRKHPLRVSQVELNTAQFVFRYVYVTFTLRLRSSRVTTKRRAIISDATRCRGGPTAPS